MGTTAGDRSAGAGGLRPDAVRREAQRLVSTGFAALSAAANRIGARARARGGPIATGYDALGDMLFGPAGRHRVATDAEECCRCPVCRVIAAARRPDPVMVGRLATGVGRLAEQVARAAGTLAAVVAPPQGPSAGTTGRGDRDAGVDPWAAATGAAA